MIMAGTWVLFVKITMQVPKRPVIGAVLGVAVKTILVGASVSFIDLPMEAQMSLVIPGVPPVIVVVGKRCAKRSGYDEHGCRDEHFAEGHDGSPMRTPPSEDPGVVLSEQS
jgi:hypothetical protein